MAQVRQPPTLKAYWLASGMTMPPQHPPNLRSRNLRTKRSGPLHTSATRPPLLIPHLSISSIPPLATTQVALEPNTAPGTAQLVRATVTLPIPTCPISLMLEPVVVLTLSIQALQV